MIHWRQSLEALGEGRMVAELVAVSPSARAQRDDRAEAADRAAIYRAAAERTIDENALAEDGFEARALRARALELEEAHLEVREHVSRRPTRARRGGWRESVGADLGESTVQALLGRSA